MARWLAASAALTAAVLLAGCASGPGGRSGPRAGRDGPDANPPAHLAQVPDAEPRRETIRAGGPNKPYVVLGRTYSPMAPDATYRESGLASWYGRKFHGASTSSGEPYDMYAMTAAHPTLPIPSYAWVRNPANGREVIVRVNDRGPFHEGRIIDLSYTAAFKLDLLRGVAPVEVERITPVQIAASTWRRGDASPAVLAQAPASVQVPASAVATVAYAPVDAAPPEPTSDTPVGITAVALAAESRSADQDEPVAPRALVADAQPALPPVVPTPAAPAPVAAGSAGGSFWVQLGAFSRPEGADAVSRRAAAPASAAGAAIAVVQDGALRRVQAGPFASREAARDAAVRIGEALQMAPVVVERR
ncbi:septal ring lytic transglycosylase RlpA family protein [Xylophilus sp. GOD-11R]|uniref:septal ring lytic transglycosylase RlpA family protein n=1 Tax=Xylophilus sp. GOD-11R TaxID=3089814 RepID=UPI00298BD9DF|nr:septal ring lytic transglycosylase RlpA family protein [Xylophilus sp. GOD-11R]WPB57122.1 septal ring lytic transglycosylase RlpA family protein [Xylophilus sp. GOD-11R]